MTTTRVAQGNDRERKQENSLPACMHMFTGCVISANKVHFGIRHPWFLKLRAMVVPYPPILLLFAGKPLWISLAEPPSLFLVARPFLFPLPRLLPAHSPASHNAFATFTLYNPPSLLLSLSILSLSLIFTSFPPSSLFLRSLEQPLLACRFFSSPPPVLPRRCRRSSPSAVALASFVPYRPARPRFPCLLPSPRLFPRTRTPSTKNPSPVWAQRGVSPFASFYPLPIIPPLPLP